MPGGVVVKANPQPVLGGVTPTTVGHGASTPMSITGSGFVPGALVVVDGPGTSVSSVVVVSPTQITATVTVDAGAPLTSRNVWVELPGTGPGVAAAASGLRRLRHRDLTRGTRRSTGGPSGDESLRAEERPSARCAAWRLRALRGERAAGRIRTWSTLGEETLVAEGREFTDLS